MYSKEDLDLLRVMNRVTAKQKKRRKTNSRKLC